MNCGLPGFTACRGISHARILEGVAIYFFRRSSRPLRAQICVSCIGRRNSFTTEPPGKPKNTGVGNLSLLHGIFLTHESNRDLLNCRQILYQLSCQESPSSDLLLEKLMPDYILFLWLLFLRHFLRIFCHAVVILHKELTTKESIL